MTNLYFHNQYGESPDGNFRFSATSPNTGEAFAGGFQGEMVRGGETIWKKNLDGSVDWLALGNAGHLALGTLHIGAAIEFFDPVGERIAKLSVDQGSGDFPLRYPPPGVYCSAGVAGWDSFAFRHFFEYQGRHFFSLLVTYGQLLLVDLESGARIRDPEPDLVRAMRETRAEQLVHQLKREVDASKLPRVEVPIELFMKQQELPQPQNSNITSGAAIWAAGLDQTPEALELVAELLRSEAAIFRHTDSTRGRGDMAMSWSPLRMEAKLALAAAGQWVATESMMLGDAKPVPFEERARLLGDSVSPMESSFYRTVGPPDLVRE